MTELLVLRFLLRHGVFINAVLTPQEVENLVRGWATRSLPPTVGTGIQPLQDVDPGRPKWWVRTDDIMAVHTMTLEEAGIVLSQPAQAPAVNFRTNNGSGKN